MSVPNATSDASELRLLFLGDVYGEPGRNAVAAMLPTLKKELALDFVVINGENAAGGRGITPKLAISLMRSGATVITTGDHVWDQREIYSFFEQEPRLLRPMNYPAGVPGQGWIVLPTAKGLVAVVNLLGRVFMGPQVDNPFPAMDALLAQLKEEACMIFVDFHAEATSEKVAMGHYLDGRVSAVIGTHTHIATADERVLPGGTAYLTDVGMCGPMQSVIGSEIAPVLEKFLTGMPKRFGVADGPVWLQGALVRIDTTRGCALGIERLRWQWQDDAEQVSGE